MRKHYNFAKILAFFILIVGTLTCLKVANKIVATSIDLYVARDNISFYNDQHRKTNEMTMEVRKDFEARNEIYNSEDPLVSWYSTRNILVKIPILITAISYYFAIGYMWSRLMLERIRKISRKRAKTYNKRKRANC